METSLKQTLQNTGEQLTFLQEDSHASLTHQQAKEKAQQILATSGRKCLEQYEKFSRATLWGKMFAASLIGTGDWYSTKCKLTWKLKATKSSRFYFQLAVSTLPTEGIGFGLLPTPLVMDTATNLEKVDERRRKNKERNNGKNGRKYSSNGMGTTLNELKLSGLLPTPTANIDKGGCTRPDPKRQNDTLAHSIHHLTNGETGKTSQLSHRFVLEMMGFPPEWCDLPLKPEATQSSRKSPSKSSKQ